ncbi:MDR family MFS transporter [Deinococcus aquiradiocola]|uniref:MFS transporter n=1 Tax=Deinococcus aquiradiocola TaxID=393059 RepID=A0A917ULS4_9DEIO|nr:MFS transporter [Deinococcus aquiradiocola]GGJ66899.1 MFS transporter [Deinococcus aquiradiocola]
MWSSLHPNVRTRITTSFLSRLVGGAVFPFMAVYFTAHLGAGRAAVLLALLVLAQFLAGLYGGGLADAWGRRRTLLLGEALKFVAFAGMLTANAWTPHPWATFAAVLAVNVASGLLNPAAEAMLVDVSTPQTRTFMYAVNYWAVNASLLVGSLLGGWLYRDHFPLLLALMCGMSAVTWWLSWARMTETRGAAVTSRAAPGLLALGRSYRAVLRDPAFLLFTLGGVAVLGIEFSRANWVAVHLAQTFTPTPLFGLPLDGLRVAGVLTAVNTLLIVAFTAPVTAWIAARAPRPTMQAGFVLFAAGFAVLACRTELWVLLLGSVVLTVGELLYVPTRQALLADLVPEDRRGAYLAVNGQVFTLAKWVATLGLPLGAVWGASGMAALTFALGLLGVLFSRLALRGPAGLIGERGPVTGPA